MTKDQFRIGQVFWTGPNESSEFNGWVCTDIGARVIVAVRKTDLDENPAGPPYSIAEDVFDEYDMEGCLLSQEEWQE